MVSGTSVQATGCGRNAMRRSCSLSRTKRCRRTMISMSSQTVPTLRPDVLLGDAVPDERRQIAAGADHGLLLEHGEDAAQDEDRVHPVEPGPPGGERPEILHHLEPGERTGRESHLHDTAVLDGAAVGDGHLAAHRHHPRVLLDHPHQLLERVLVEDRVGVERDEIGRRRGVDAGVEGVRLAAVLLVDHHQVHQARRQRDRRLVHAAHPARCRSPRGTGCRCGGAGTPA